VFVGVTKFKKTNLIFVDPEVKIDGIYCSDMQLTKQLLHVISGEFFIFQHDGEHGRVPAHRARETIILLAWEKLAFISPDMWFPTV